MAKIQEWFGPTQVLGPQERQILIEAGVMTKEDFTGRPSVPPPASPPVGGSSAQADKAKALGITVEELRRRQDAQLQELLKKRQNKASGGMISINPRKPLDLTVRQHEVEIGKLIDEFNRAQSEQAYNESRQRMLDARRREDTPEQVQPTITERIMAEMPSPWYKAPPSMREDPRAEPFKSKAEAVSTGMDPRLGIAQMLASPLMVTDAAEMALDAVRGVKSPSRFGQASNALSKLLGGPEDVERSPSSYDPAFMAAMFANPGNFLSPSKVSTVVSPLKKFAAALAAPRGVRRLLSGHSLDAVATAPAVLRDITHADDFYEQAQALSKAQDKRGAALLRKGSSIPDMLTDMLDRKDNGGRVFEVLPTETNKRGWAMTGPNNYISGIMSEEGGSKDFTNATLNALIKELGGEAHAVAANEELAKMYRAKGIPVDKEWRMKFAGGGAVTDDLLDFEALHGYK